MDVKALKEDEEFEYYYTIEERRLTITLFFREIS